MVDTQRNASPRVGARAEVTAPKNRPSSSWLRRIGGGGSIIVVGALLLLLPLVVNDAYNLGRVQTGMIYVLVAIGLNIPNGYAGEFTLGHAAVMAVGAYASAILCVSEHWSMWLALPAGVAAGVVTSLALGAPGLRIKGAYLALLTIFAVLAVPQVVSIWSHVTGGDQGLAGIPSITLFSFTVQETTYELSVVAVILAMLVTWNLMRSSWSARFRLLRDAPRAAEAVGLRLTPIRVFVYAFFGTTGGLAGVLYAYNNQFVNATTFDVNLTLLILTGVILGGKGTLWGPVVGTVPLVVLTFYIGPFSSVNPIIFGGVLAVVVTAFPNGLVPFVEGRTRRGRARVELLEATVAVAETEAVEAEGAITAAERPPIPAASSVAPSSADESSTEAQTAYPLIEVRDLCMSFGGIRALDDLSLAIPQGRVVALVGQNGCGKSTLLNAINGFYRVDSGTIHIDGINVTHMPRFRRAALGVGRTFQIPRLINDMSVADNIASGLLRNVPARPVASMLGAWYVQRDQRSIHNAAVEMLDVLGLPRSLADVRLDRLPLGLKRIVEVGRAAVLRPRLLLLDEPAAGLNEIERHNLAETVKALCAGGITPVVVEHNIDFVLGHCDLVILMDKGTVSCIYDARQDEAMPEQLRAYLQYSHIQ